jgi:hypothetical protein
MFVASVMQHSTEVTSGEGPLLRERDVASQWSAERIGQRAFVASTMQHSTEAGAGPLLRGEKMLHHSGQNEKVSERLLHQRCNTVLKRGRAHFGGEKRCCITVRRNVTGR